MTQPVVLSILNLSQVPSLQFSLGQGGVSGKDFIFPVVADGTYTCELQIHSKCFNHYAAWLPHTHMHTPL